MHSHHTTVTGAPGKSTYRAWGDAAKAALRNLILCPILDSSREKRRESTCTTELSSCT